MMEHVVHIMNTTIEITIFSEGSSVICYLRVMDRRIGAQQAKVHRIAYFACKKKIISLVAGGYQFNFSEKNATSRLSLR